MVSDAICNLLCSKDSWSSEGIESLLSNEITARGNGSANKILIMILFTIWPFLRVCHVIGPHLRSLYAACREAC
jgi:hypothetical protein